MPMPLSFTAKAITEVYQDLGKARAIGGDHRQTGGHWVHAQLDLLASGHGLQGAVHLLEHVAHAHGFRGNGDSTGFDA